MKNLKFAFTICIVCCIYMLSCKKDPINNINDNNSGNKDSIEVPKAAIVNTLKGADSLQQFAALFETLTLGNIDAGGVTILAVTNNSLNNPSNPENLKDYIIKGIISPSDLTDGKVLTSITGKQITITVENGKTFANGVMISVTPVAIAANYSVYAVAGLYISGAATYNDPHKNEYYIEYYENGTYHSLSGRYLSTWQFFSSDHFPTPVGGNCSYPAYNSYSSGPSLALLAFTPDHPFWLQVNRKDFTSKPETGEYKISKSTFNAAQNSNTGNCNLVINGAVFGCDVGDKDAYVRVKITEVKVDEDLGIEKRGYYRGEFDAILYYSSNPGSTPEKRIITAGRFMAPMGGNETGPINGTAPLIDRLALLTTGKWYFRPIVELDPDYPSCNYDDYMVFRANGTCDFKDGAIQCPDSINEIDHVDNIRWSFTNNQTVINIASGEIVWKIISISDSSLTVSDTTGGGVGVFAHGN